MLQLYRARLPAPGFVELCDLAINLLVAVGGDGEKPHAFRRLLCGEPNFVIGVLGPAGPLIKEIGSFEVAITLRQIANVVKGERAVRIQRIRLEEILPGSRPIIMIRR